MHESAESHRVDASSLPWRDTPCAGVSWKKLRFAPGAAYAAHRHPRGEQYLVLEGTLQDGAQSWGPGSYVWHAPGSVHAPRSATGCTVFVVLPAPIETLP